MAKDPAFLLYVRDWLCSRKILSMSGDAVKAYLYLLCESWLQEPRATLPTSDEELASLCRVSLGEFLVLKKEILVCFSAEKFSGFGRRFFSERLYEESRKRFAKQRLGNKNAKQTQSKRKVNARLANANANDLFLRGGECEGGGSVVASPLKKGGGGGVGGGLKLGKYGEEISRLCPFFGDGDFSEAWNEHREVRRTKRGALTGRADRDICRKLSQICGVRKRDWISCLNRSSDHGWVEVYPPQGDGGGSRGGGGGGGNGGSMYGDALKGVEKLIADSRVRDGDGGESDSKAPRIDDEAGGWASVGGGEELPF